MIASPTGFKKCGQFPDHDFEFDMLPICPREVKCALKKCFSSSVPGNDNITY